MRRHGLSFFIMVQFGLLALRLTTRGILVLGFLSGLISCGSPTDQPAAVLPVQQMIVEVVAEFPHDGEAFTQGLEFVDGRLFESTGLVGQSQIREIDLSLGLARRWGFLNSTWFGEGFTALPDGRLVQLTWKSGRAAVWDIEPFSLATTWSYGGQGWGICLLDSTTLVMSDGSSSLTLRSPEDFRRLGQVEVTQNGQPVDRLNELECVDGTVWANVWQTDLLLGIDPVTGAVTHEVDASMLPVDRSSLGSDDVLNGIAFHAESGHFFLTGKRWPTLFEVTFVPADGVPLIQP